MPADEGSNLAQIFPGDSEMARRMRETDWAATPLGPPETWPSGLTAPLGMMLTSRFEMWLGWGEALSFFYNDAYIPTLGAKHPWALGEPFSQVWREVDADVAEQVTIRGRRARNDVHRHRGNRTGDQRAPAGDRAEPGRASDWRDDPGGGAGGLCGALAGNTAGFPFNLVFSRDGELLARSASAEAGDPLACLRPLGEAGQSLKSC